VETEIDRAGLQALKATIAGDDNRSLIGALESCVSLYKDVRAALFDQAIVLQRSAEQNVMAFFERIKGAAQAPYPIIDA
jgi:hypothetical protein